MRAFSLLFCLISSVASADGKIYGKMDGKIPTPPVSLSEAIKDFSQNQGKEILVTGTVKKVCQMSGCWFELADNKQSLRITMKDYGFTVPKDILNKPAKVVGVLEQKELPAKVVRHYMKDEGKSQQEIDKVTQTQKVFEFVATGVEIL